MTRLVDAWTSAAAVAVRGHLGRRALALGPRPAKPLELWEFEACPFCRKVREAISLLDLDARVHPCPKGGERHRGEARARGGKLQFPFLVDPNAGELALYESDAIIAHLFASYGRGTPPLALRLGPLTVATASLSSGLRAARGTRVRSSRAPTATLELFACEGDPASRRAREVLTELELLHLWRAAPEGGAKRDELRARFGSEALPRLVDASHDGPLVGADAIVAHLERTYAAAPSLR